MSWHLKELLSSEPSLAFEIRQGIEREGLRVNTKGEAAITKHPSGLGHKLTHKYITTDYSENLLELISGVHSSQQGLFNELSALHAYTYQHLEQEFLWPNSMPCILPQEDQIPIADFGDSHVGKLKTLYRKGLGHRYGQTMQSIAGVHYNFSLTDTFWKTLHAKEESNLELVHFKNEKYFHLIRNFQRYRWVLMYFFGASNIVHSSFLEGKKHKLEQLDSKNFYTPHGVSLRMGGLGYTSQAQKSIRVCFNNTDSYIRTLEEARLKSYHEYEKIGLKKNNELQQLNTHLLQIDNEFYSTIRPKNIAKSQESALKALYLRGVEYIEVRLLDINPFAPLGITAEQTAFLSTFLLWCLQNDSEQISSQECNELEENFNRVVNEGRKRDLNLNFNGEQILLREWLATILKSMEHLVDCLAKVDPFYAIAFDQIVRAFEDKNILSQELLSNMRANSFIDQSLHQAKVFRPTFSIGPDFSERLEKCRIQSFEQERSMQREGLGFERFLKQYFDEIKITGSGF